MNHPLSHGQLPILVSFSICPFVQRSVIAMNVKGQAFERLDIDLADKPDWFLQRVPTGKVPALLINADDQEQVLFESAAINEYLDEQYGQPLLPVDSLSRARQRAWVAYADQLIMQQFQLLSAPDQDSYEGLKTEFIGSLLRCVPTAGEAFFDGVSFSLVDAAIAPLFTRLKWLPDIDAELRLLAESSAEATRLLNWKDNLLQLDAVRNSTPEQFDTDFFSYFRGKQSYAFQ